MAEAKKETGLPIATEVANAKHVEGALEFGVDLLWIGARTTVNPFSVQDIADALRGCHIDVYIKNPVAPDSALWLGAIERMERAGIKGRIVAIHRGFCAWEKDIFRNNPIWSIPLWLKAQRPDIPVVCDPSHISGQARLVPYVSRMALSLGFDGLFIESHCNPAAALSDAAQQLTPEEVGHMFQDLKLTE